MKIFKKIKKKKINFYSKKVSNLLKLYEIL